jgi:hypothetical protein
VSTLKRRRPDSTSRRPLRRHVMSGHREMPGMHPNPASRAARWSRCQTRSYRHAPTKASVSLADRGDAPANRAGQPSTPTRVPYAMPPAPNMPKTTPTPSPARTTRSTSRTHATPRGRLHTLGGTCTLVSWVKRIEVRPASGSRRRWPSTCTFGPERSHTRSMVDWRC